MFADVIIIYMWLYVCIILYCTILYFQEFKKKQAAEGQNGTGEAGEESDEEEDKVHADDEEEDDVESSEDEHLKKAGE